MTPYNALGDDLQRLHSNETAAAWLETQLQQSPPSSDEHRLSLRRRLLARYRGESPVTTAEIGIVVFETQLGYIGLAITERGVARLVLPQPDPVDVLDELQLDIPQAKILDPASFPDYGGRLRRYARGEKVAFDFEFDLRAQTDFQRAVLAAIRLIPHGQVRTYKEVAAAIQRPKASRAVGNALGNNPVPLMIPCHRVVTSSGKLGGYSGFGGTATKQRLLTLERA